MKLQWHSPSGNFVKFNDIVCEVIQHHGKSGKIFIGTDSHRSGDYFIFATVICLHGAAFQKGGVYYFTRKKIKAKKFGSLYHRMFHEAERSIEVHLDVSPPTSTAATSRFSETIRGYVSSAGFKNKIKPNSWASFSIADKHAK